MNNHYELLYLVGGNYSEEELDPIKEKVKSAITKQEGNITFEENYGKKKLSYAVDKNFQGYYLLTEFDLEGQRLDDLSKDLKLTNELLRHIIVKRNPSKNKDRLVLNDEPKTLTTAAPIDTEAPRPKKKIEAPKPVETPVVEKKKEEEDESKIKLEDLDEKLDEILEGEIK